ncbi:hypothetical protein MJO28_010894 [Puccinia striiformis f. sp. tritici]|uniref:Uncharacterized protein n=1 Tax=Puccinia striiformis f. sp. tritici TaxID=168172 RepID=A0ACC0E7V6_9BASI|nr:hypothetical protein MJO28_010894 [Puccinia striiformis f. sp. tritici]
MARAKKTTSKAKKTSDPAIIIPTPSKTSINKTTDPTQNISEAIKDDLMTTTLVESKKAKPKKIKKDDDDDSSTRHIWTTVQQATFLKEIANGHTNGFSTNNGNLKKEGGRALTKKMLAKHGFAPTAGQIKNQKAFLRQTFVDVKFLHNQSGFGWDEDQSLVTADEDVWADEVEVEPVSLVQTTTTNTTKRVQDNKNTLIETEMEGIHGAIQSVAQKADGLVGAFNMIATAISHSHQPKELQSAGDSTIPASERALDLCAERFLGQVPDDTYAGFIEVLEIE